MTKTAAPAESREAWLNRFIVAAGPAFAEAGFPIPANVRASIGFPSTGRKSKRIGECWADVCSQDGHFEVFLHPALQSNTSRIADILTHELVHAAVGLEAKHGPIFRKCATALGLIGKMTATLAGPVWHKWADPILKELGPLPGANLGGMSSAPPKQTTRMLKVTCSDCDLIVRASKKFAPILDGATCPSDDCDGHLQVGG